MLSFLRTLIYFLYSPNTLKIWQCLAHLQLRSCYSHREWPIWYIFMAGGITRCTVWAVFYPANVIKSPCTQCILPLRKIVTYNYKSYIDYIPNSIRDEVNGVINWSLTWTIFQCFPNNGTILTVVVFSWRLQLTLS